MIELQKINYNHFIRPENNINKYPKQMYTKQINKNKTMQKKYLVNFCKNWRLLKLLALQTEIKTPHNYYKTYEKILKRAVNKCKKLNKYTQIKKTLEI